MSTSSPSCRDGSPRRRISWPWLAVVWFTVSALLASVSCGSKSADTAENPTVDERQPALSSSAYQVELRSATNAVAQAFDRLANAGSPEDAGTELRQASTAASEAARLLDVDPPVEVLAVHRDLIAGLRQLATELSQLGGHVASMELCAMPSILAAVSNASGVNSLRTVREDLGSGRLGVSYQWGEFLPAPTTLPERRLANEPYVKVPEEVLRSRVS